MDEHKLKWVYICLTNLLGKAILYLVIALWKLEKPIVRKAPSGAFRHLYKENCKMMRGGENLGKKQFLTYDEQITFLEEKKGLIIHDKEYAKRILLKIGYFPLINGYKEIFKESRSKRFQKGTTFEDIYELYSFDNDLRNIFLKYILIAERNIKSSLAYHFCKEYGDLQSDYLNIKNYDYTGKKKNIINKMIKIMSGQLRYDSDYTYIRHYMNKYQYVPLWALMNILTIGQLSKIYASQKGRIQIRICQDFGPLKVNEFGKMLTVMTKFRNVCAHNDRLFNFRTKNALLDRNIYDRLQIPKEKGRYKYGKNDLYAQVIILKLLLADDDFSLFYHDLKVCFKNYPIHKKILEKMGFPENWEQIVGIEKYTKSEI